MNQRIIEFTTIVIFLITMSMGGLCLASSQFNEDFSDGNFTINPAWTVWHATYRSGTVTIVDGAARFYRSGAGGSGRSEGMELSTTIDITPISTVTFDAKPVYRSVRSGCGDNCTEHPVNIQLTLEDNTGNEFQLRYAVNYGGAVKDVTSGNFKQIAYSVTKNTWARNLSYKISDSFPTATKITHIKMFGAGWDFDGYIDNIKITGGTTPPPPTPTPGKVSLMPVYDVLLGNPVSLKMVSASGLGDFVLYEVTSSKDLLDYGQVLSAVSIRLGLDIASAILSPTFEDLATRIVQAKGIIPTFNLLCAQEQSGSIVPMIWITPASLNFMNDLGIISLDIKAVTADNYVDQTVNNVIAGSLVPGFSALKAIFDSTDAPLSLRTTRTSGYPFLDGDKRYLLLPRAAHSFKVDDVAVENSLLDRYATILRLNLQGLRDMTTINDSCVVFSGKDKMLSIVH